MQPTEHPAFNEFVATIEALRSPDGCPWDKEQTHKSISGNMVEEAYEAVDAIEADDVPHMREELGDVLLQVVLQSQIAADAGEFTIDDVCRDVNAKIMRRHPHVFGDVVAGDANEVLDVWDQIKMAEKESADAAADAPQGLLDGVCITGGEPLLQSGIDEFCTRVHELGFAVKLDTNGSFPGRLRALVEEGLVDYVATDVKNAPERYAETVGVPAFDLAPVQESLDFLRSGAVPYEVRTTVVRELHTADDLRALAAWIEGVQAWHLQSFIDADSVLGGEGRFHAWDPDDLRALLPELQAVVPGAQLRGVD